jgi:hypothetical protein
LAATNNRRHSQLGEKERDRGDDLIEFIINMHEILDWIFFFGVVIEINVRGWGSQWWETSGFHD